MCSAACQFRLNAISLARKWKREPASLLRGFVACTCGSPVSDGPTLEIFEYSKPAAEVTRLPHRPGFAHIAFAVDSVAAAREQVLSHGGSPVGDVVTVAVAPTARVTWCYVRDPEGNIVELQAWS